MTRTFVPFHSLWDMKIDVPYSFLVRDGALAWSCGQLAMDRSSEVMAPGDLIAQSEIVCDYIEEIIARAGLPVGAVRRLYLYYVHIGDDERDRMLAVFRARYGVGVLLDPIPVPHFYYDGVMLEVDVFCGLGDGATETQRLDGLLIDTVSASGMTWTTVHAPVQNLPAALRHVEVAVKDTGGLLSEQWFAPSAAITETSVELARSRPAPIAGCVVDVGRVGAGVRGVLSFGDGGGTPSADRVVPHEDVELVIRSSGEFVWIQARCADPGRSLVEQTRRLMPAIEHELGLLGMTFRNVVKSTTHYVGSASADDLHDNMSVRNAYYCKPGPASTGVPVRCFSDKSCKVAVDILAIAIST